MFNTCVTVLGELRTTVGYLGRIGYPSLHEDRDLISTSIVRHASPFTTLLVLYHGNLQNAHLERATMGGAIARWHANPRTSLAYRTACTGCTKPPDVKLPILCMGGKTNTKLRHLALRPPQYSDSSQDMHSRANTRYGFLRKKFHFPLPKELVACACGELPQTVEHMFLECPIHEVARYKHLIARGRVRPLNQLFNMPLHCVGTSRFMEESQAWVKPRKVD